MAEQTKKSEAKQVPVVTKESSLFEKYLYIQQVYKSRKDEDNDFGKYKYRNIEVMLSELKPILAPLGLVIFFRQEIVSENGWNYIKETAVLWDGKDELSASAHAREQATKSGMDTAQISGAASTYAKKYAVQNLLGIDDGRDDPDSKDNKKEGADSVSAAKAQVINKQPADPVPAEQNNDWGIS